MEHLVVGIANINFQQNFEDILTGKLTANPTTLPLSPNFINMNVRAQIVAEESPDTTKELNSSNDSVDSCPSDNERPSCSSSARSGSSRRNLPSRACKENSLRMKRRSIMKPAKRDVSKTSNFAHLNAAAIKKIYLNKNLTNFRPTNLETIFEESQDDTTTQVHFVGLRKMKRSLSCSDGFNINKTLAKQRRARIKKVFGRRAAKKNISLDDFLVRLNKSIEGNTADAGESNTQLAEVMTSTSAISHFGKMDCLCQD